MIDPDKVYHVYPTNDLEEHYLECVYPAIGHPYCPCKCEPEFKEEENSLLIVHNSFDGREGLEWVNEVLKLPTCYKTGGLCKYKCEGLCRESC